MTIKMTRRDALRILGVRNTDDVGAIKRAYRLKVKRFHPDAIAGRRRRGKEVARQGDERPEITEIYQAYELLVGNRRVRAVMSDRRTTSPEDPFAHPQEPAKLTFVNELLCLGRSCPTNSCCVAISPNRFAFAPETGAARSMNSFCVHAGDEDDAEALEFAVYRAVNLCPRMCINYCTEAQHEILSETLAQAISGAEDKNVVGMRIEALVACANYNNGRNSE